MGAKTYLNFDLLIDHSDQGYVARVLDAPAGTTKNRFTLPFSDLELENLFLRVGRSRRVTRRVESPEAEAIKSFGGRLYDSVFGGSVGSALRSSMDMATQRGAGLRIRLHLSEAPELADLPWEYLYNPGLNRFFVLSRDTPVVRYLELDEVIQPLAIQPPLRILSVIASPSGYPALDVEQEWSKLQESVGDLVQRGLVVLDRLQQPTLSALQRRLRQVDYHVFHFVGHGAFDARAQDGMLLMQDSAGAGRPVSGQDLGTLLHDQRTLRLAVLNACEGARTSRTDVFAGTAQSLLQQGIPAVIAMQFEISDAAAITISHEFYAAVADGYPVDAALAEARKAVFADSNATEWGTPVLYMRAPDGRIFDVAHDQTMARVLPPKEAAAPPPAPVATPKVTREIPEAALAAAAKLAAQDDTPAARRTVPAAEVATPAAKTEAAAVPQPAPGKKRRIWPGIAGGLVILLAAGVYFSGLGRALTGRSPAVESSAALPLAAGGASTPSVLAAAGAPTAPAALVAAAPSPTREGGAVAAVLPAVNTSAPAETAAAPTNTPLPAPTNTPQPAPTNTAPPAPTDTPQRATDTPAPTPTRTLTATGVPPTAPPAAGSGASTTASGASTTAAAAGAGPDVTGSGSWIVGDQHYGTLASVSAAGGSKYAKLDYDIPGDAANHFVVFRHAPPATLPGQPQALTLWVYGDGSGNFLNVWVRDAAGQVRQFPFGRIQHANSWQPMTAMLDTSAPWPQAHISGPDSPTLSYPLSVFALALDAFPKADATAYTGTVYLTQLRAGADAGNAPAGPPPG